MTYEEQYLALLNDEIGKLFRFDHHGVGDASNDLRVFEAAHPEMVGRFKLEGKLRVVRDA